MSTSTKSALLFLLGTTFAAPQSVNPLYARALDPNCAPGGNFDLSIFNLQLPTGTQGNVDTIFPSQLAGCSGFKNQYFTTASSNGALVMKVPGSKKTTNCVSTPNSDHCRTELREIKPSSWDPKKNTNRLKVEVKVKVPDDSKWGTVIGQVKIEDKTSKKPLCELFYNKNGEITLGVSQIFDKSSLKFSKIADVPVGTQFTYELRYEKSTLSISINGGGFKTFGTGEYNSPPSYFKVGNYNQGDSASEVLFYSINVNHG